MNLTRRKFLLYSGLTSFISFNKNKTRLKIPQISQKKTSYSSDCDPWIELNLENMSWNLDKIRKICRLPVMAVIKANAYGHGLVEAGRYLDKKGIDYLMVCKLQEARQLRNAGVECPIHNFGPFCPENSEELIENNISQSVFTKEIKILNNTAQKLGKKAKIHIHIDTGMGRMGIPYYNALPFITETYSLKNLHIEGISTTLTEDHEFDIVQLRHFLSLCKKAEKKGISLGLKHAASSDGLFSFPKAYLDMVRPGILIYGYYPSEKTQKEDSLSLKPVLQLKSRVAAVKMLRPGDSISYHRAYIAKSREKIAVIPIGYSDGLPYNLSGKGFVLIRGERFPIVGSVTANHIEVKLKLDYQITSGEEVVLMGSQGKDNITADEIARWSGISTYKILIRLNPLLPRKVM